MMPYFKTKQLLYQPACQVANASSSLLSEVLTSVCLLVCDPCFRSESCDDMQRKDYWLYQCLTGLGWDQAPVRMVCYCLLLTCAGAKAHICRDSCRHRPTNANSFKETCMVELKPFGARACLFTMHLEQHGCICSSQVKPIEWGRRRSLAAVFHTGAIERINGQHRPYSLCQASERNSKHHVCMASEEAIRDCCKHHQKPMSWSTDSCCCSIQSQSHFLQNTQKQ